MQLKKSTAALLLQQESCARTHGGRYQTLQVLRVVCALMVLVVHNLFYAAERLTHNMQYWSPHFGEVDIFFVMSGFVLITSSEKLFGTEGSHKVFLMRRLSRVAPLYWLATTLKLLTLMSAARYVLHASLVPSKVLLSYFFLPSMNKDGMIEPLLGVAWTLSFEVFFYLLFAAALFSRKDIYRTFGSIAVVLSILSVFRKPSWPAIAFVCDPIVLDCFLGMVLARLVRVGALLRPQAAIAAMVTGVGVIQLVPWDSAVPRVAKLGLPAALIVYGVLSLERYVSAIPRSLSFLAQASYAIYLFHPLVAPVVPEIFAHYHFVHTLVSTGCGIAVAVAVGSGIHYVFERPLNQWMQANLLARPAVSASPLVAAASQRVYPAYPVFSGLEEAVEQAMTT